MQDSKDSNLDSKKLENSKQINSVDSINQYFIESLPILSLSKQDSKDSKNIESKIPNDLLKILKKPIDSITDKLFETNNCKFLPKLYGIYKNINEIDFDKLPDKFVLKTNHDCGSAVLIKDKESFLKDKINFKHTLDKLSKHLNTNYYELYREYHYKAIKPRIFAEEILYENALPDEFRFMVFNQKAHYIQTGDLDRDNVRYFYDRFWNFQQFNCGHKILNDAIKKPYNLDLMLTIVERLSIVTNFVRIDVYECDNKMYVGEMTFTPLGGTGKFTPDKYDRIFGELWKNT